MDIGDQVNLLGEPATYLGRRGVMEAPPQNGRRHTPKLRFWLHLDGAGEIVTFGEAHIEGECKVTMKANQGRNR